MRARTDRKPGDLVGSDTPVAVAAPLPYVSRGGEKLAAALDAFEVDPAGRVCLDVGASTGGFTDALLQRGAARVHAIDVGRGQLAESLRNDPRVVSRERTNAREPDAGGARGAGDPGRRRRELHLARAGPRADGSLPGGRGRGRGPRQAAVRGRPGTGAGWGRP